MKMFVFCRIENTNLICYRNGTIVRQNIRSKKWVICKGSLKKTGYLQMGIDGKLYLMHRVIAHAFKILDLHSELMIDHRDLDKTNNCIFNLRPATNQQNQFNTNAKGYYWNKHAKKWKADICLDGKKIYLGLFETEEEARQAYIEAKNIYHKLNVSHSWIV